MRMYKCLWEYTLFWQFLSEPGSEILYAVSSCNGESTAGTASILSVLHCLSDSATYTQYVLANQWNALIVIQDVHVLYQCPAASIQFKHIGPPVMLCILLGRIRIMKLRAKCFHQKSLISDDQECIDNPLRLLTVSAWTTLWCVCGLTS